MAEHARDRLVSPLKMDVNKRNYLASQLLCICQVQATLEARIDAESDENEVAEYFTARRTWDEGYANIIRSVLQDPTWSSRFSEDTIRKSLDQVTGYRPADCSEEAVDQRLNAFITRFESYDKVYDVYIPLSGVVLHVPTLELGDCSLVRTDEAWLDAKKWELDEYFGSVSEPERFEGTHQRAKLVLETVTRLSHASSLFSAIADLDTAKRLAQKETESVIDLLRYCIPFVAGGAEARVVGVRGEHAPGSKIVTIISKDFRSWSQPWEQREALAMLHIDEGAVGKLGKIGVQTLSDILKSSERNRTEYESMLLRAAQWFADSGVQRELANKFLSLTICFETFFTPEPGEPISDLIAEGVAFALSSDLDERLRVKRAMKRLYGLRSNVSHGRTSAISEGDLEKLQDLAERLMTEMVRRRGQKNGGLRDRDGIRTWMERERMAPSRTDNHAG